VAAATEGGLPVLVIAVLNVAAAHRPARLESPPDRSERAIKLDVGTARAQRRRSHLASESGAVRAYQQRLIRAGASVPFSGESHRRQAVDGDSPVVEMVVLRGGKREQRKEGT